jgi:hypothetical protein
VLYTSINSLEDDILLSIFSYFRRDDEDAWNVRLGWRKLSNVCQRWRHLVYSSAFHLGMHILCTNGTPIVDILDHLPPLPLFVNYQDTNATISEQDELGIYHALRLRDRVQTIELDLPPSILHRFLLLMDEPFPILETLSLVLTYDPNTSLTLPKTFLAPNLHHLSLHGVGLPTGLRFLSTVSLVTLTLTDIPPSAYFSPSQLVASLRFVPHLEALSVGFSIPIPRPSAERELLGTPHEETPLTLPNLRNLTFEGVGAYLERLVSQISAPLLEKLAITLFSQIAFALPHLSHLAYTTEGLKLPIAGVCFGRNGVTTVLHHDDRTPWSNVPFLFRVLCKQLDWQIDCTAQICSALMPVLAGVEMLTLEFNAETMPSEWQNGEIDSTTWLELLRPFIGVKKLIVCNALLREFSRALQAGDAGSDPGLLPCLRELECWPKGVFKPEQFDPFIDARRIAGRRVLLSAEVTPVTMAQLKELARNP